MGQFRGAASERIVKMMGVYPRYFPPALAIVIRYEEKPQ